MATPRQVLDLLGIEYIERPNRLSFCCPFHGDTDPSTGFYEDTELAHCFACAYTLTPARFYAKYMGVSEGQAEKDLEKRFGERKVRLNVDKTKNQTTRARMEKELKEVRPKLTLREHANLGELMDRVLLLHERGLRENSDLDTDSQLWYNSVKEATDGPDHPHPQRASRDCLDDRLQERLADVPGPGRSDGEINLD